MPTSTLAIDGLWQCLCPSFSRATLTNATYVSRISRRPALQCLSSSTPAARRHASDQTHTQAALELHQPFISDAETEFPSAASDNAKFLSFADVGALGPAQPRNYVGKKRTTPLIRLSTPFLYELLRKSAGKGETAEVQQIVEHLIGEREEQPNLRLYASLILVNVNPRDGAAWRVANLLEEMKNEGLQMDVGVGHDVLKVLSVHVDYLLRADVLAYMRQRWFGLTADGFHDVAAGLFREGQFELAVDTLRDMRVEGIHIQPWLYDMAVYLLAQKGEIDEALNLMKERVAAGELNISKNVWYCLLDVASQKFHHAATSYVWNHQVIPEYINPASGLCLNVLTTAARRGDTVLATEAFRVLGNRSTVFQNVHYDQLLLAYMSTSPPDLRAALAVLTIMASTKLPPTAATVRPIYRYLKRRPHEIDEVMEVLASLHKAGREVPIAALNMVIEFHINERDDLASALTVYKSLHEFERIVSDVPHKSMANIETFNILLKGTRLASPPAHETALFLVSELLALHIQPTSLTYDRLVLVFIVAGQLELAWRYFDEMDKLKMIARPNTVSALGQALAGRGDERTWDLIQRAQDSRVTQGMTDEALRRAIEAIEDAWGRNQMPTEDQGEEQLHAPAV